MILALAVLLQTPLIIGREPVPASPMTHTFEAACPGTRLRISGHGIARPLSRRVQIETNGRAVGGPLTMRMARDLSHRRAVYRLVALCGQDDHELQLQIYVGETDEHGIVHYWAGSAGFLNGRLLAYRDLEPATAETFWFR